MCGIYSSVCEGKVEARCEDVKIGMRIEIDTVVGCACIYMSVTLSPQWV